MWKVSVLLAVLATANVVQGVIGCNPCDAYSDPTSVLSQCSLKIDSAMWAAMLSSCQNAFNTGLSTSIEDHFRNVVGFCAHKGVDLDIDMNACPLAYKHKECSLCSELVSMSEGVKTCADQLPALIWSNVIVDCMRYENEGDLQSRDDLIANLQTLCSAKGYPITVTCPLPTPPPPPTITTTEIITTTTPEITTTTTPEITTTTTPEITTTTTPEIITTTTPEITTTTTPEIITTTTPGMITTTVETPPVTTPPTPPPTTTTTTPEITTTTTPEITTTTTPEIIATTTPEITTTTTPEIITTTPEITTTTTPEITTTTTPEIITTTPEITTTTTPEITTTTAPETTPPETTPPETVPPCADKCNFSASPCFQQLSTRIQESVTADCYALADNLTAYQDLLNNLAVICEAKEQPPIEVTPCPTTEPACDPCDFSEAPCFQQLSTRIQESVTADCYALADNSTAYQDLLNNLAVVCEAKEQPPIERCGFVVQSEENEQVFPI